MSNKTKSNPQPKLRFPEFRNIGPWKVKKLSDLLSETKKRNRKLKYGKEDVLSVSGEYGCVNQIEFMGRSYAGASVENYHVVETGNIVYTKSPLKKNPYGIIKENKGKAGIVSTLYAVYKATEMGWPAYLDHYFSGDYNLNSYLQPIVKKGAKNDMKVNNAAVLGGEVSVPEIDEQRKIANCLSSFDELFKIETKKLDILKDHKKGLMQELFPAEGQTLPKLRFPEFQNAPEWEEKEVGEIFEITRGNVLSMNLVCDEKTEKMQYPVYSSQTKNNGLCGFYSAHLYENAITWTTDGAGAGDVNYRSGKFYCTNVCGVLLSEYGYANPFVAALLNSISRKHVSYVGNPKLMNGVMSKIVIPLPKIDEQQRIADFLTSADDLITAQSQKLDELCDHKKGLMQQLFPTMSEAQE